MQPRVDIRRMAPDALATMLNIEKYLAQCGLDRSLVHLVKVRASQINGCAYCLDMHWKDARADGETEQRLYALDTWRETPFYTPRERAALAWAEALTLIAQTHAPDDVFGEARAHFSERELADLSLAVATINAWNRLSIGFRAPAGTYQPAKRPQPAAALAH